MADVVLLWTDAQGRPELLLPLLAILALMAAALAGLLAILLEALRAA